MRKSVKLSNEKRSEIEKIRSSVKSGYKSSGGKSQLSKLSVSDKMILLSDSVVEVGDRFKYCGKSNGSQSVVKSSVEYQCEVVKLGICGKYGVGYHKFNYLNSKGEILKSSVILEKNIISSLEK